MRAATRSLVTAVLLLGAAAPGAAARELVDDVNPFVGTLPGAADFGTGGGAGNTFPGATTPFGMVAFSPDSSPAHRPVQLQLRGHPAARLLAHPLQRRGLRDLRRRAPAAHHRAGHPLAADRAARTRPRARPGHRSPPRARRAGPLPGHARPRHPARHRQRPHRHHAHRRRPLHLLEGRPAQHAGERGGSSSGNTAVRVAIDPSRREVSGMVESGLFCAQPSKYRVYFSARFNQPFAAHGTWSGQDLRAGTRTVSVPAGGGGYVTSAPAGAAWRRAWGSRS